MRNFRNPIRPPHFLNERFQGAMREQHEHPGPQDHTNENEKRRFRFMETHRSPLETCPPVYLTVKLNKI
ncbi:hypothetical protein [Aquamicrobium ahrensii]|uniref:Uncharacterized protein n=1 Tax=Aquamicrobium ahrensii TaxID=469551 RepID=A0ABV2KIU8_9HYPH